MKKQAHRILEWEGNKEGQPSVYSARNSLCPHIRVLMCATSHFQKSHALTPAMLTQDAKLFVLPKFSSHLSKCCFKIFLLPLCLVSIQHILGNSGIMFKRMFQSPILSTSSPNSSSLSELALVYAVIVFCAILLHELYCVWLFVYGVRF